MPLQLLRAGVQLAALIPAQALDKANAELNKSGVPIDLTQLKPEQLEALVEHLDEMLVEVDAPDARNLYARKLVFVRPDQHVAWRGDEQPAVPMDLIDLVRGGRRASACKTA